MSDQPTPIIPPRLQPGDTIRVISPAVSLAVIHQEVRVVARRVLEEMGFDVTFGDHAAEQDIFDSSPVASRVADIHAAFADDTVGGILTTIGGYNSHQLLDDLDYDLIGAHPKVLCGFSDITALSMAIYARTGLVTYSGPHFTTFGMVQGAEYTRQMFRRCVMESGPLDVPQAEMWSDDHWFADQADRTFVPTDGYYVITPGTAEGRLLGGNASTVCLLHGTRYQPPPEDCILLLEDDAEANVPTFDRYLQAIMHQPGFDRVRGLVIGRFQRESQMTRELLTAIVRSKPALAHIPVIADANFGHTTPQFTVPVGGTGRVSATSGGVQFTIVEH